MTPCITASDVLRLQAHWTKRLDEEPELQKRSEEILQREPRDTLPVYLGDDIGDEHAFRVLRPLGVTIRIGRPHLPTAAEWRLGSVDDVASFLEHWKTVVARR